MKRTVQLILMMCMLLMTQVALAAASGETIEEGADIASVKRLAIAYPDYFKEFDKEPTIEEFTQLVFDASKSARCYVISYDEIAAKIKAETLVDIKVLPKMEARKIYNEHVAKYADAYLIATVANYWRINFFGNIYKAGTNELLYSLQIQGGKDESSKSAGTYKRLAETFYKTFDTAAQEQMKKNKNKD